MGLKEFYYSLVPLFGETKNHYVWLQSIIGKDEVKPLRWLVASGSIGIQSQSTKESEWLVHTFGYPHLVAKDTAVTALVRSTNDHIKRRIERQQFVEFSKNAEKVLPLIVAPHIEGLDIVKHALALQLVAKEPVHILLLGDPGTGKTDLIRSAANYSPTSVFALGSGATGVGLTVSVKGKTISKGILPQAHEGVCALDELNLVKKDELGSLYNAMEKGFVTYDKSDKHLKFDAKIRLMATANPKGDRFVGKAIRLLKQQIPFETALLSRFHCVFFLRAPNVQKFVAITKNILNTKVESLSEADQSFVQRYVEYARTREVDLPKSLEQDIVQLAQDLKEKEDKYLVDVSPRTIHGIVRLAKASAALSLRRKVLKHDLDVARQIITTALQTVN